MYMCMFHSEYILLNVRNGFILHVTDSEKSKFYTLIIFLLHLEKALGVSPPC